MQLIKFASKNKMIITNLKKQILATEIMNEADVIYVNCL